MGKSSVPSKVLGYMAAARPIIASVDMDSDTGKMISDANCGICTESEDADGLTAAILELYNDPDKAERLGTNGRSFLVNSFDRKRITAQYERFFIDCTRLF
jgi:colanic acid biosynthesis glycosyl transferase WcaI